MALRKAIVNLVGQLSELPTGDTIVPVATQTTEGTLGLGTQVFPQ
jgi:hypothetical protein